MKRAVDPRSLFCLNAVAIRIAQRMGLHYDGGRGFSALEIEMRRRLWWQLVHYDHRIGEVSGVGASTFLHLSSTAIPVNVNDRDLYPQMHKLPRDHVGITDTTFCIIRCEIANMIQRLRLGIEASNNFPDLKSHGLPPLARDGAINDLETQLEQRYLVHCDISIPLHFLIHHFARQGINKLRLLAHHPRNRADRGVQMPKDEKDRLFSICTDMVENYSRVQALSGIEPFVWWINFNVPVEPLVHLLAEVRLRKNDGATERAWSQVSDAMSKFAWQAQAHDRHFFENQHGHEMHKALMTLASKAWEAHAAASAQVNATPIETPEFIERFRQLHLAKRHRADAQAGPSKSATASTHQAQAVHGSFRDSFDDFGGTMMMLDPSVNTTNPMDWINWNDFVQDAVVPSMDGAEHKSQFPRPNF